MSLRWPRFTVAGLVVSVLLIAGCGGTDPSPAVDKLSEKYTSDLQTGLEGLGVPPSEAERSSITVSCPDSVTEGEPFDCSITGNPGGKSLDVEMKAEGETIDVVNESEAQTAVNEIFRSVAVAISG